VTSGSPRWVHPHGATGTFANAGTLTVITNDVAIAGNVFM
jgi:hypothetical protein